MTWTEHLCGAFESKVPFKKIRMLRHSNRGKTARKWRKKRTRL